MRKFLIVLAFVIFPLTAFLAVSQPSPAQAQTCLGGDTCIGVAPGVGALGAAVGFIWLDVVGPGYLQSQTDLIAFFPPLSGAVWDGMQVVMDWTFKRLSDWFATFWNYNVLPEMNQMTKQLVTADVEQAFALGMFSDAANIIRNQGRTVGGGISADDTALDNGFGGDYGIKDHREQRPGENVCTAASLMPALERANTFSDAYLAYGAGDKQWIAANSYYSTAAVDFASYLAIRWNSNAKDAKTGGDAVAQDGTWGYVPLWCNASYNDGFAGCKDNGKRVGNDVDVAGMLFAQDTIPLNPDQSQSPWYVKGDLDELVTNLAESFGKDPVTAGEFSPEGILNSLSYRTKRQIVYDSLFYVISRRVPGGLREESSANPKDGDLWVAMPSEGSDPGFVKLLKAVRAETGEDGNTGCGGTSTSPCTSPNPSRNEMLRAMLTQRFQSGKYALRGIDEPENNQREQVINQALQLIQMNDQMDLMDHWSLLLASQVSNEIVKDRGFSTASGGASMSTGGK